MDELANRINHRKYLEEQERQAASASSKDEFDYMDINELRDMVRQMYRQAQEDKLEREREREEERLRREEERLRYEELLRRREQEAARLQELLDRQDKADDGHSHDSARIDAMAAEIRELKAALAEKDSMIAVVSRERDGLQDQVEVLRRERFGATTLSGTSPNYNVRGKNDGKDDFDGTPESLPAEDPDGSEGDDGNNNVDGSGASASSSATGPKEGDGKRPYRQNMKYDKAVVDNPVIHRSDLSKLEEGDKVIKKYFQTITNLVLHLEGHKFEMVVVKKANGKIDTVYLPVDGEDGTELFDKILPKTHVTTDFVSFLAQEKYEMAVPSYREALNRLANLGFKTCRQNLFNWLRKGATYLQQIVPALKEAALHKGAIVNVDETWCRFQDGVEKRKTYMWGLINPKARIVIYFYEDSKDENGDRHTGGRSRKVIKEFIGDADIQALQSDGYNVYMYIEKELLDMDHLCCMAHARAKFKYALNQKCGWAQFFVTYIGYLYDQERLYKKLKLSPEEIYKRRNSEYTKDIVEKIRARMLELLALPETAMSDLMRKALNYLHTFWKQLFKYLENGNYSIDNSAIEQMLRPLANQRKNSLFIRSIVSAKMSAIYNTFVSTCKLIGVSFRRYFEAIVMAIKAGRTDFENLLPSTIGL